MGPLSKPTSQGATRGEQPTCDLLKRSALFRAFLAEREEILKHKWIESEKAGCDIGFENAVVSWVVHHRVHWQRARRRSNEIGQLVVMS